MDESIKTLSINLSRNKKLLILNWCDNGLDYHAEIAVQEIQIWTKKKI